MSGSLNETASDFRSEDRVPDCPLPTPAGIGSGPHLPAWGKRTAERSFRPALRLGAGSRGLVDAEDGRYHRWRRGTASPMLGSVRRSEEAGDENHLVRR